MQKITDSMNQRAADNDRKYWVYFSQARSKLKKLVTLTLTFYFSEKKLEYNTVQLHVYKEEYIYAW